LQGAADIKLINVYVIGVI